jgi:hypothetical protein
VVLAVHHIWVVAGKQFLISTELLVEHMAVVVVVLEAVLAAQVLLVL